MKDLLKGEKKCTKGYFAFKIYCNTIVSKNKLL